MVQWLLRVRGIHPQSHMTVGHMIKWCHVTNYELGWLGVNCFDLVSPTKLFSLGHMTNQKLISNSTTPMAIIFMGCVLGWGALPSHITTCYKIALQMKNLDKDFVFLFYNTQGLPNLAVRRPILKHNITKSS